MTWEPLFPPTNKGRNLFSGLRCTARIGKPRRDSQRESLIVLLNPAAFDTPPSWLVPNATVDLLQGTGQDRGSIRLVPGKYFRLSRTGSTKLQTLRLLLPVPQGISPGSHPRSTCDVEWQDSWLQIDLPSEWQQIVPILARRI